MVPATTPRAARIMINVTPTPMIAAWPKLSIESEVWLFTAAVSQPRSDSS